MAHSFKSKTYKQTVSSKQAVKQRSRKGVENPALPSSSDNVANQMKNLYISQSSKRVDPQKLYHSRLISSKRFFALTKHGFYALADCDESGALTGNYCLLQSKLFCDSKQSANLLLCSCDMEIRNSLAALSDFVDDDTLVDFVKKEEDKYCIHRRVLKELPCFDGTEHGDDDDSDGEGDSDEYVVDQLSVDPLLVAVLVDNEYGLVQGAPRLKLKLKCLTCAHGVSRCDHVTYYRNWAKRNNILLDSELHNGPHLSEFTCVSYKRIPYPLTDTLKERYHEFEYSRMDFPLHLIPTAAAPPCCHGNKWDNRCPVQNKWVRPASTKIYKLHSTLDSDDTINPRTVFYRPTVERKCLCTLEYDGQEDLLFNLDAKNLVYYDVLFRYLYDMVDTGTPLSSFSHACRDTNNELSGKDDSIPLHILRRAWNAFARLLDIDYTNLFKCDSCGSQPDVVICDATSVGVQKNLLTAIARDSTSTTEEPIKGSKHKDRVFFKVASTRKLLLNLCGFKDRSRKRNRKAPGLKAAQLRQLQRQLVSEEQHAVAAIIGNHARPGRILEEPYGSFFGELARNSPACGTFQIAGEESIEDIIRKVARGEMDIRQASSAGCLTQLQNHAPLIATLLTSLKGVIPQYVRDLLLQIVDCINAPFGTVNNDQHYVLGRDESPLTFFPGLPVQRGHGVYEADRTNSRDRETGESCRKESWGHHTLSPGIFTVYCSHGICHGFTILESNESPRHPFEIFVSRFKEAPAVIIYDNSCKLHQYALNREPDYFKRTKFFVDRFHWRGHVACSEGYNLSSYKNKKFSEINSQINEQENAGIQRLKGHLSYMLPDNFRFHLGLYFAVKNLRKR